MKPKILRSEEVAADGSKIIPTMLGVSAGCQPRFLTVATYRDERNDVTLRSNYFGQIEIASPVDGLPMAQVGTSTVEITADELHASSTQVGSCDHCSTDIFASKTISPELAGTTGHCTMCGSDVAFEAIEPLMVESAADADADDSDAFADDEDAEATEGDGASASDDEADDEATGSDDTNDSSSDDEAEADDEEASSEAASDTGAEHYAFDDMVLVNEDEEELATMAKNKSAREAIAAALRKTLASAETANAEDTNTQDAQAADATVTVDAEVATVEGDQPAAPANEEADQTIITVASDCQDGTEEAEDDLEEDDELPAMSSDDEEDDEELANADTTQVITDQPISDYVAVDLQTADFSSAVILPTSETATMFVMLGDTPALRLSRENASATVQGLWAKPANLRDALTAAFANTEDRQETLASFGGSVVTVPTSMRAHAASVLAKFTAKAEAEVAAMNSDNAVRFKRALDIAALGVIKNMFPEHANTIVTELSNTLERHGVRNPQGLVLAAFRDTLPDFVATVIEKASELAVDSDEVLTRTSALVGSTPFPVELPQVVANTTDTATVIAPATVDTPAPVLETAANKIDTRTAMERYVASLGR